MGVDQSRAHGPSFHSKLLGFYRGPWHHTSRWNPPGQAPLCRQPNPGPQRDPLSHQLVHGRAARVPASGAAIRFHHGARLVTHCKPYRQTLSKGNTGCSGQGQALRAQLQVARPQGAGCDLLQLAGSSLKKGESCSDTGPLSWGSTGGLCLLTFSLRSIRKCPF